MSLLQVLCGKQALDEGLVGAPGLRVKEEQTQEDGRPGDFRRLDVGGTDGVQFFRVDLDQVLHTVQHGKTLGPSGLTQNMQSQERNHETAHDQQYAVYRVRYRHGFQSAENRVAGADDGNSDAENHDSLELTAVQYAGETENILKDQRTGVENDRNLHTDVQDNISDAEPELGRAVIAETQHLGDRGNAAFQIAGGCKECQDQAGDGRADFKGNRTHIGGPGLSVGADQLLGRDICQQQRAGNHNAGQAAARKKIAFGSSLIIAFCLNIRDDRNRNGKTDKGNNCPKHEKCPFLFIHLFSILLGQFCGHLCYANGRKTARPVRRLPGQAGVSALRCQGGTGSQTLVY